MLGVHTFFVKDREGGIRRDNKTPAYRAGEEGLFDGEFAGDVEFFLNRISLVGDDLFYQTIFSRRQFTEGIRPVVGQGIGIHHIELLIQERENKRIFCWLHIPPAFICAHIKIVRTCIRIGLGAVVGQDKFATCGGDGFSRQRNAKVIADIYTIQCINSELFFLLTSAQ